MILETYVIFQKLYGDYKNKRLQKQLAHEPPSTPLTPAEQAEAEQRRITESSNSGWNNAGLN
ncbi:MAG: hypothetical protein WDN28_07260 [Chthoniobacter sp.]